MDASRCLVVGLVAGVLGGCAFGRTAVFEGRKQPPPPVVDDEAREAARGFLEEADVAWKARTDVARIHDALAAWEAAALRVPTAEVYVSLSRAYFFLADTMAVDGAATPALLENLDLGTKSAERALALSSPAFVDAINHGTRWEDAVKETTVASVPALYWYAANLGRWARAQGTWPMMNNRERIKATMAQCLKLDPDYFYAGPHRYFGAYFALALPYAGGDLAKSEGHFRESILRAPNYVGSRVLMAETWAKRKGDRAMFEKLLKDVLAAEPSSDPDLAPEQELEKKKAQDLLSQMERLF